MTPHTTESTSTVPDIDECANKTPNCQQICTNAIGSFICSCYPSFSIDEAKPLLCVDIDECAIETSNCQQICTNAVGSFICSCDPGFSIDEANPSFCVVYCSEMANEYSFNNFCKRSSDQVHRAKYNNDILNN
ncbi:uncharacterized protein LOC144599110 [Rhinoraja longicauda]